MRGPKSIFILSLLLVLPGASLAADRWVTRRGSDVSNDCLVSTSPCRSVEHALAAAVSGDTVNVASGIYKVRLEFTSTATLTLLGGWDTAFTTRDPEATPTTLKARIGSHKDKRVIVAIADAGETVSVVIDGFVLTGGNAHVAGNYLVGHVVFQSMFQDGGGGLYVIGTHGGSITMTVRRSAITHNRSTIVAGGGVFVGASFGGSADVTFDRSTISDNRVEYGGGMEILSSQAGADPPASVHVHVTNSIITRNRAHGSAAIFALQNGGQAVLDLVNSTVTANRAREGRGESTEGALVLNQATANITNSILWGNLLDSPGPTADLDIGQDAVANVSHSDVGESGEVAGGVLNDLGGNVSVDPQLVGFELAATSPLIDAGTCVGAPVEDFEGDPRPSGAGCDIGADEFAP